jgi:hypothetical protein
LDDHTILATDEDFGSVSVCPGGVVHISLRHYSLKFVPSDFTKLADLIGKARLNLGKRPELAEGKPRLQLVPRNPEDPPTPTST